MAGRNPSVVLKNNPYAAPQFYFPLDLGSEGREPYVIFDIRDGVAVTAPSKGTIALYMPADIKASYRAAYEEAAFGVAGLDFTYEGLYDAAAQEIKRASENPSEYMTKRWEGLSTPNDPVVQTAYALAVNQIPRLQRDKRRIVNPHMSVLFKGMGFRTFSMNFTLVAKSAEESDMIRNIIYTFKYHMHPGYPKDVATQRFLLYPENFVIGFFSPSPNYLFQISPCVLENIDVDYAGAGLPAFYASTGAPVQVNLTLNFKETEILTKERISEGL